MGIGYRRRGNKIRGLGGSVPKNGSVFKNPANDFAGRLLEAVGAKDLKVGGAYVWSEHANVIVRGEGATASDVLALARLMHNRVQFRLGITLESEVQF